MNIGSRLAPYSEGIRGDIAEIILFDSVLSSSDRNEIELYLAYKWGLEDKISVDTTSRLFSLDSNGTLSANQTFDYETDDRNYS